MSERKDYKGIYNDCVDALDEKCRELVWAKRENGRLAAELVRLRRIEAAVAETINCDLWGTFECPNQCGGKNQRVCAALQGGE
jgi:hypothetical protein